MSKKYLVKLTSGMEYPVDVYVNADLVLSIVAILLDNIPPDKHADWAKQFPNARSEVQMVGMTKAFIVRETPDEVMGIIFPEEDWQ